MSSAPRIPLMLVSGNAHPGLAEALARELKVPLVTAEVGAFADGEIRVHVNPDVRDVAVFIVQPTCPPVNDHLMVLALLADAVRAAGAARVTGIVPYFGYARHDIAAPLQVLGDVEGRACLVVDDMASTGRTLAGAADALRQAGAKEVHAIFTHAVMAPGAVDRFCAAQFGKVLTSDSIPVSADPWLETVPIAPLMARTVRYLCGEGGESDHG